MFLKCSSLKGVKDEGKTHALQPYIYTDSIVSETLLQIEKLWNYLENHSFISKFRPKITDL